MQIYIILTLTLALSFFTHRHGHAVGFAYGATAAKPRDQQYNGAQHNHCYWHLLGAQCFGKIIDIMNVAEEQRTKNNQQDAAYLVKRE